MAAPPPICALATLLLAQARAPAHAGLAEAVEAYGQGDYATALAAALAEANIPRPE